MLVVKLVVVLANLLLLATAALRRAELRKADEEPVDQKKILEDRCKPKCVKPLYAYRECVKRVEADADETGHKHCTGQYFDYWSCVDKCVSLNLFDQLK